MKPFEERRRVHYIHYLSYSAQERMVGVFILLALAFVFSLMLAKGRSAYLFEPRIVYHAYLENAQGVSTETLVKISGIEVGRVFSVDISPDNRIHIKFFVYDRFHNLVRTDSKAALSKLSVIGSATIEISAGSPDRPIVPEEATITIEEPESIDDMIERVSPVITQLAEAIDGLSGIVTAIDPGEVKSATSSLSEGIQDIEKIADRIAAGEGVLGRAVFSEAVEADFVQSMDGLRQALMLTNQRLAELQPLIENADYTVRDARSVAGELPALIQDLRKLSAQMNATMGTINMEVQELPELISRMRNLMEEADRTVEGLQHVWPISEAVEQPAPAPLIEAQPLHD